MYLSYAVGLNYLFILLVDIQTFWKKGRKLGLSLTLFYNSEALMSPDELLMSS